MPQRGSYQPRPPRPSNASTNVSRYSDSGSTHRKGTDVMFCVMWLVDASNSTEPSAANASHSTYSPAVGAGSSSSSGSGAANAESAAFRTERQAVRLQARAKTAYAALHAYDCVRDPANGSIANGNANSPSREPRFER